LLTFFLAEAAAAAAAAAASLSAAAASSRILIYRYLASYFFFSSARIKAFFSASFYALALACEDIFFRAAAVSLAFFLERKR
jgi:hypothetical protein